jgi:hypothetical protein
MKPKLESTKDYELFKLSKLSRPLHKDKVLLRSMQKYGFLPSCPIHCVETGNGKLKVIQGQHRLHYAKKLGLPVYYVIDDSNPDLSDLEAVRQKWELIDFAEAYANSGNKNYIKLLAFKKKYRLPLGAAASLLSA